MTAKKTDKKVPVEKLRWRLDPATLPFNTTKDLSPLKEIIGQDRGVQAFKFGMGINKPGYNVFVTGIANTGRLSTVRKLLEEISKKDGRVPNDLCYVNNFKNTEAPILLRLKAGTGQKFKNHYESTKFEAERIVREYADRIPTVIFRPTIVVGDSHSGEIEKIDGPYYGFVMISRNLHIAIQKSGHTKCHIAPVDFVTDAIAAIYEKPDAAGKVFHVGDPQPMLYDEFFDLVCERWGKFKPLLKLPPKLMGKLLEVPVIEKTFGVLKESFPYTHLPVEYGFDNMLAALEDTGLRCPTVPEYVDVMIDYFKNHLKPAALKKQRW